LAQAPFVFAVSGVHWDDAYIFFRFAENLSRGDGLAFNPGELSAGVTSILWTLILALLTLAVGPAWLPFAAKVVGVLFYSVSAGLWSEMVARWTDRRWIGITAGILIAANPLGVVLAISGMDTPLSILVFSCVVFVYSEYRSRRPLQLGLLLGLSFLARPDVGVILAVAIVLTLLTNLLVAFRCVPSRPVLFRRGKAGVLMLGGAALMAVPWLVLLYGQTGNLISPAGVGKLLQRLPSEHGVTYAQFLGLGLSSRIDLAGQDLLALFG
ncbi:MAG: hypothetical protein GTO63_21415, partial [Anaerolineae bacterium]|nr:hypothetical protein [Anaerolineae bacterium]NIN97346.1 hypothetical protein [Anaerolineae bacterium]